jgi:hypothetical protein
MKNTGVGSSIASATEAAPAAACPTLGNMNARVDHVLEVGLRLSADERAAEAVAVIDSLETVDAPDEGNKATGVT